MRRMPLDTIDPSLALGFYCRDRGMLQTLFHILNRHLQLRPSSFQLLSRMGLLLNGLAQLIVCGALSFS